MDGATWVERVAGNTACDCRVIYSEEGLYFSLFTVNFSGPMPEEDGGKGCYVSAWLYREHAPLGIKYSQIDEKSSRSYPSSVLLASDPILRVKKKRGGG